MAILYQKPDDAAGMLVITFSDHKNEQFVDLAAFVFDTLSELHAAYDSVAEAPGKTAFLLDRHVDAGHDADKYVTAEWIEQRCGKPIAELIEAARRDTDQYLADWLSSRAA